RCWETSNRTEPGKLKWAINLFREHHATAGDLDYGFFGSPLLYGDRVIVAVGHNTEGAIWAFDRSNGKVAWKSAPCGDRATASPTLIWVEGVPSSWIQASSTGNRMISSLKTTKWEQKWATC